MVKIRASIITWSIISLLRSNSWAFSAMTQKMVRQLVKSSCLVERCPTLKLHSRCTKSTGNEKESEDVIDAPYKFLNSIRLENSGALKSILLLNAATVIWGTQHSVLKSILELGCTPATINASRFLIAAVILTLFTSSSDEVKVSESGLANNIKNLEPIIAGAELGVWTFLGFAFQSVGLLSTTVSRSAFLLYLNVKMVPIFAFLINGRRSSISVWLGAAVAIVGTFLLCGDGGPPNSGDFWSLLAAASSAMYILRLGNHASNHAVSELSRSSLWTTAILCTAWTALEQMQSPEHFRQLLNMLINATPELLYLGIVVTAFTTYLQALGQKSVPAERAALIYALDPVYAAIFAYFYLGETLGTQGLVGASMISVAAILNQIQRTSSKL